MTIEKIITEISEKYGICTYGFTGMEVIRNGKQIAKFTGGTRLENWEAAVRYAEEQAALESAGSR